MNRAFAFALLLFAGVAFGDTTAPPSPPSSSKPADDAEAIYDACAESCTVIAGCWERVNKRDYRGGGRCTEQCTKLDPAARKTFHACVEKNQRRCRAMLRCE